MHKSHSLVACGTTFHYEHKKLTFLTHAYIGYMHAHMYVCMYTITDGSWIILLTLIRLAINIYTHNYAYDNSHIDSLRQSNTTQINLS